MRVTFAPARAGLLGLAASAAIFAACSGEGENRPQVDLLDGSAQTVSVSASGFDASVLGPLGARYKAASDVEADYNIAADLRDLRALMAPAGQSQPVDWTAAKTLYEGGKNQVLLTGRPRSLASLATDALMAQFPDATATFGRPSAIDAMVRAGLDGTGLAQGVGDNARRQIVDRGVQMLMYGVALDRLAAGRTAVQARNLDVNTGAPHLVDGAWAAIAGPADEKESRIYGLLQTALSREEDFGITAQLYIPLETWMITAQKAARDGNLAAYDTAVKEARGYLNGIFYLSVLRNAQLLRSDTTPAVRETLLADGRSYFQVIRPAVASASATKAAAVEQAYERPGTEAVPAGVAESIYGTLNDPAVLTALGVPKAVQAPKLPAQ